MEAKDKIASAQAEIIDTLARCEQAIARLYEVFAINIPALESFWSDLSDKEKTHARLLKSMHKQLDRGHIFRNIGRFKKADMEDFLQKVGQAIDDAQNKPLSQEEAINLALKIESSVLDAHFYDIVVSDAEEYRIIADRLSADTHSHVKMVQNKLLEIQSA